MPHDRITKELALFSATEEIVAVLKQRGASREEAWAHLRALSAGAGTESLLPVAKAQFDLVWPEGTP
ncbi:hypothetical protein [Streptomyces sp. CBMA29]|uniref:hypothetical protein n=1 Tax=Streptomyces sp. CBMA29 TaxID=1896314 RepID=UPI001662059F|nr:hypothetical protein [Streptomyces sp. CBMA29]